MTIYGFNSKKCTPPYCNNNALINKNLYCEHYYHYYRPFDKIQYCNHCKCNHCGLSLQKTNFKSRLTLHFIWIDTWFCLFLAKFIIVCPSIAFAICIFKRRTAFLIFNTQTVMGFKKYALVTPPSIYLFVWSWNSLQIKKSISFM